MTTRIDNIKKVLFDIGGGALGVLTLGGYHYITVCRENDKQLSFFERENDKQLDIIRHENDKQLDIIRRENDKQLEIQKKENDKQLEIQKKENELQLMRIDERLKKSWFY
jgi:hypothetical protein